jgi:predicted nucleic acid-binding protein
MPTSSFPWPLGGPVFNAILEVAKRDRLHLLTSAFCYLEAWRNVELKVPERRQALKGILEWVRLVPEARPEAWMADLLPEKDVPVLAAAVAVRATHLFTGDLRHFAPLMAREDLPLRVLTPGDFVRRVRP